MVPSRAFRAVALALLAAAGSLLPASTSAAAGAKPAAGALVKLHNTALGQVLIGPQGKTLYLFTPDKRNTSVCYGKCASFWPPLLTTGTPRAGKHVKASLLGIAVRKDGKHQVTYGGHPLYYFVKDKKAGQTNGQAVEKVWWVVSAAGTKITAKPPAATPVAAPTLQLRATNLGTVLVDSRGMTLYLYTPDTSGTSTCYDQCASFWPPLVVTAAPVAGQGLDASLLATTTRTDGTTQVTYAGHPLYLFAKDAQPGDTAGQGVGGVWYALSTSGAKVESPAPAPTTTTTASSGTSGY
jgi:predicted lipoprotein with Yx(FWY)xxD motif